MTKNTKNRVKKAEDTLWDMHHQISEMMNKLHEVQNKLPKTKYVNSIESMEEISRYLDNAFYTIEYECSKYLLEDGSFSNELDLSLLHHRDVKELSLIHI